MSRRIRRIVRATLLASSVLSVALAGSARAQLANAPWPMLHHDARHTGQSEYVGPQTATVQWMAPIGYPKSSPTIGADGTIYIGNKFTVYAFDPAFGVEQWRAFPHNLRRNAISIDVNDRLYFGSRDNRVKVLSAVDGSFLWWWRIVNDGDVNTSPAIAFNPAINKFALYFIGTWNGRLHAFDPDPGLDNQNPDNRFLWVASTFNNSYSSPAVGSDGTVYSASAGKLYAVEPDGQLQWAKVVGRFTRFTSPAIGADGTIYIGSGDGLSAVTPTGNVLWTFPVNGQVRSTPAIATDGTIYVGSTGLLGAPGQFYAVNPNGTQKWVFQQPLVSFGRQRFLSSPAIGADGTIYTAAGSVVYALTPAGSLLWQYDVAQNGFGGRTTISSPAIGANGALYIGAGRGLYAFRD
jgi:outer membrane protein assembly factor BamB